MKLKKFLAITMSAALAMTALTACGSKTDDSKSSDKKTAKVIEIDLTDAVSYTHLTLPTT